MGQEERVRFHFSFLEGEVSPCASISPVGLNTPRPHRVSPDFSSSCGSRLSNFFCPAVFKTSGMFFVRVSDDLAIVKMDLRRSEDLVVLMPFSGNEDGVLRARHRQRAMDGFRAIKIHLVGTVFWLSLIHI